MSTNYVENSFSDDKNKNISNSEDKDVKYLSCNEEESNEDDRNEDEINEDDRNEDERIEDDRNEDDRSEDESSEDESSEDDMLVSVNFSVKDNSTLFVLSIDGVPNFYTTNIKDLRQLMWDYAKSRRIQETQYNTYIRDFPDKNRIEIIGTHKFSIFFVDRVICRLLVSEIREVKNDAVKSSSLPKTQTPPKNTPPKNTPPKNTSPQKSSFFSSFFW
jgi:hypothetical protein